jgi:hypothetical protein
MVDHNIKIEKKLGISLELNFTLMKKKKDKKNFEMLELHK